MTTTTTTTTTTKTSTITTTTTTTITITITTTTTQKKTATTNTSITDQNRTTKGVKMVWVIRIQMVTITTLSTEVTDADYFCHFNNCKIMRHLYGNQFIFCLIDLPRELGMGGYISSLQFTLTDSNLACILKMKHGDSRRKVCLCCFNRTSDFDLIHLPEIVHEQINSQVISNFNVNDPRLPCGLCKS